MPTYSYACTQCDNRFDVVQAFTDDSLTTCDQCSGRLRKLFSSVGVVFKGSGFYRTDSREAAKASINGHSKHSSSNGAETSSDAGSSNGSADKSGPAEKTTTSTGKSADKGATSTAASTSATAAATSG